MTEPSGEHHEDELSLSDQPTLDSGAMETLREQVGRGVDPGVELDPVDPADAETIVDDGSGDRPGRPADALPTPRYTIHGEIARGGMGAIYKVRDKDLRRSLAMKVILGGSGSRRAPGEPVSAEHLHRFLEEAQVTAQLAHPGIVPVHELGIDHTGRVYFTMSLVRGETLSRVIEKARAGSDGWTTTRALQVILRVCDTMAFAHDKGVIHRDLKPANVMVGRFGVTYVMDWGLAKVLGREDAHDIRLRDVEPSSISRVATERTESADVDHDSPIMTMDGAVLGTPAYMPPEQAEGRVDEVDKRSDVYAIGALLYQLLTGEAPYVRSGARMSPHAVLAAVSMGPPRPVHEVDLHAPEELQAICEKAMSRERAERYATAEELAEDLQRYLGGRVVHAHRTGAVIEMKKWVQRNRAIASTVAAAAALLTVVIIYYVGALADESGRAGNAEIAATSRANEADTERRRADARAEEADQERERADDRAAEAEAARDAQQREAVRTRSYALTQVSAAAEPDDPMLALLLSREAARTLGAPHTASRLRAALFASAARGKFTVGPDPIASIRRSPSGEHILTLDIKSRVRLFDGTGTRIATLGEARNRVASAIFSSSGESILTAEATGARLYDLAGRELVHFRTPSGYGFDAARFDPTEKRVFTTSGDRRDRAARLWNADGTLIAQFDTGRRRLTRFSPLGTHVLTAYGSTLLVWESSGELVAQFPAWGKGSEPREWKSPHDGKMFRESSLEDMFFSPSGRQVLAVFGISAYLLDLEGARIAEFGPRIEGALNTILRRAALPAGVGHTLGDWEDELTGPAEAPTHRWTVEGDVLEVAADWGRPFVFETPIGPVRTAPLPPGAPERPTGASVRVLGHLPPGADDQLSTVTFPPGGRSALTGHVDGTVRMWRLDACEVGALPHADELRSAEFVASAGKIVTVARDGVCRLWSLDGTIVRVLADGTARDAAASPDGTRIAIGTLDNLVQVLDLRGTVLSTMRGHESPVNRVGFSPDGARLLSADRSRTMRLWDVEGGQLASVSKAADVIAFSPDGERLVSGDTGSRTTVWTLDGAEVGRLPRVSGSRSYGPQYSPAGRYVLSPIANAVAGVYSENGSLIASLSGHFGEVRFALFTPDVARVLTGSADRTARLWSIDGDELAQLRGHQAALTCGAVAPTGSHYATGAEDGAVRLWDADGRALSEIRAHETAVRQIAFSPDGRHLLTRSDRPVVRVWLANEADVVALADERVTREFSADELEAYAVLLREPASASEETHGRGEPIGRENWTDATRAPREATSAFRIVGQSGPIAISGSEIADPAEHGASLPIGADIDGRDSSFRLRLPSGDTVEFAPGSRARVEDMRTVTFHVTRPAAWPQHDMRPATCIIGVHRTELPGAAEAAPGDPATGTLFGRGDGRIGFKSSSGTLGVVRGPYTLALAPEHAVDLTVGSGTDTTDLAYLTHQQNTSAVSLRHNGIRGRTVLVIPPATGVTLERQEGGKLKVSNDITSRKTAKVEIRTEFDGPRGRAALGPGTYAVISVDAAREGDQVDDLWSGIELGLVPSIARLPWPTAAANRITTAQSVIAAAIAGDREKLRALYAPFAVVRRILAAEAAHTGATPPSAEVCRALFEKQRTRALNALLVRSAGDAANRKTKFIDQGVFRIVDKTQVYLVRAVEDGGVVRMRAEGVPRDHEILVLRHDGDWYFVLKP